MFDKIKDDGNGILFQYSGKLIYIDFENLKDSINSYYKVDSNKIYEIGFQQTGKNGIGVHIIPFSKSITGSKYVYINLSALEFFEILNDDSQIYKAVVQSRSNITVANNIPKNNGKLIQ